MPRKKKEEEKEIETRFEKRRCMHKFTDEEIAGLNENIAELTLKLRKFEEEKKLVSSIVSGTDAEITKASNLRVAGQEEREMDCPVIFDFKSGVKTVKNPETLEVIETTAITADEREQDLPMGEDAPEDSPFGTAVSAI